MTAQRLVIAFGGNALVSKPSEAPFEKQYQLLNEQLEPLLPLLIHDLEAVIVHGNGPQVGISLERSARCQEVIAPLSIDYAVAESQGSIGYMFQHALNDGFSYAQVDKRAVSLVTMTEVDPDDPAFANPTKPVGNFMDEQTAKEMAERYGWSIMEDAGRGFRRSVASPKPIAVAESKMIADLLTQGHLVVAAGGGGVPVYRQDNRYHGIEAVIDKDLTAALLAKEIDADMLLILTGVPAVAIHYGTPQQKALGEVDVATMRRYQEEGHFPAGSMLPKVEAILDFVSARPNRVGVITDLSHAAQAVKGLAGTRIVPML